MAKLLHEIITKCGKCPYCEYDPYYDMHNDSGFYCNHKGKKIIDDKNLTKAHSKYGIKIPSWCELPDTKETK